MVELREPPRPAARSPRDRLVRVLLAVNLLALVALLVLGGWLGWRLATPAGAGPREAELAREIAGKLKAAGAVDEAAALYERYYALSDEPPQTRARVAYSLGSTYLERGRYEEALRWLYEAEGLGPGPLASEVGEKIVHALDRLGRVHAAEAALAAHTRLDGEGSGEARHPESDPVVARIGEREIHRSEVEETLDDLPPEMARQLEAHPAELLRQHVADELLWRKAVRQEIDDDPEVRRTVEALTRQVAVAKLVEREVMANVQVDEADLANWFAAHRERYRRPAGEGKEAEVPSFDEVRPLVERDYRAEKARAGYQAMVETELQAAGAELFPERMRDDG